MARLELFYPVKAWIIGQGYGQCNPNVCDFYKSIGLKGHNGIDAFAVHGQPVRAAHDGIVTFSGEDDSAGLGIVLRTHDEREYAGGKSYFKTIYWHLKRGGIKVKAGDVVKVGDVLALADNTGFSTGDHLHFGLKPIKQGEQEWSWENIEQNNGYKGAIDPAPFFNGYYAEDAQTLLRKFELLISMLRNLVDVLTGKR